VTGIAKDPAVIWVSDTPPEAPAGITIRQKMKTFVPGFLIVPVGTTITFPNDDAFYHSVYSDSPGNAFDLGLYDTGPGKSVRFTTPGVVDIHCHVHGSMHAVVLVVDGPYAQTLAPGATYRIEGLTPGRHVEHTWTHGDAVTDTTIVVK
jgi:plastocyanin